MSNSSAENTYTTQQQTPQTIVEALKQETKIDDGIKKNLGTTLAIIKGRDYCPINARIVVSMHKDSADDEKAIYINQGKGHGISVSLQTLKNIIKWAEE